MTRIMTITGGCAGIGKTHLAVNLALELVRRGGQVGLYHVPDGDSPVDRFIDVQHLIDRPQSVEPEQDTQRVVSRGYLGVDILSSDVPLAKWAGIAPDVLAGYIEAMDVEDGYDEFIVDTSGMAPRELLGCCLASPVVVLVVTPEPQSQAEAFALLRILRLNGYSGELRLLVNRVPYAMDAQDIQKAFSHEVSRHLGMEVGMPWYIVEDSCVARSERYRQAFSAVFPDSEAAAGIVVIADALDALPVERDDDALRQWWGRFVGYIQGSIRLPGNAVLETELPVTEDGARVSVVPDSTGGNQQAG